MKKIYRIIKKIVVASFIIYGYNVISFPLNLLVPINLVTVSLVSILGIPGLILLITTSLII